MNPSLRLLGYLHIVVGGLGLLAGAVLCIGLWVSPDPQSVRTLQFIGPIFLLAAAAWFVPALLAGIGLLRGKASARVVLVALSLLMLPLFPVGTLLGAFGLYVLIRAEPITIAARSPGAYAGYGGMLLAMLAVGSGFAVMIGTGFRLSGDPAPSIIERGYYPAIVLFILSVVAAVWAARTGRLGWARGPGPARWVGPDRGQSPEEARKAEQEASRTNARNAVERVAYAADPRRLATCAELQPIEAAMRAAGIPLRYVSDERIEASCRIDQAELTRQFLPPVQVSYSEQADPPAAMISCYVCRSVIDVVHPQVATPETPVFPSPGGEPTVVVRSTMEPRVDPAVAATDVGGQIEAILTNSAWKYLSRRMGTEKTTGDMYEQVYTVRRPEIEAFIAEQGIKPEDFAAQYHWLKLLHNRNRWIVREYHWPERTAEGETDSYFDSYESARAFILQKILDGSQTGIEF